MSEGRTVYWFGRPWATGICDPAYRIRVPVGEECWGCLNVIKDDDTGFRLPFYGEDEPSFSYFHKPCLVEATTAGVGTPD